MYEYIKGRLVQITPAFTVVECGGLGYRVHISLQTYTAIGSAEEAMLYLHLHQSSFDGSQSFYGFYTPAERELFRLLISVSGIGANTALVILSAYSSDEIATIISTGNIAALKAIKGIGTKTAERAIVDLRDKVLGVALGAAPESAATAGVFAGMTESIEEAVSALMILGYPRATCEKTVGKIVREQPGTSTEDIIRQALTQM